jgi:hypothetical protein
MIPGISRREWLARSAAGFGAWRRRISSPAIAGTQDSAGGGPHASRPREARDLPFHARRPVADRHVRLEAAAPSRRRQASAVRKAPHSVRADGRATSCGRRGSSRNTGNGRVGQRTVPQRRQARRRPLFREVAPRHEAPPTAERCSRCTRGSDTFVRPSMGSWCILYGSGRESRSPRLHHDLADARARRRAEPVVPLSSRALIRESPVGRAGLPTKEARRRHLDDPSRLPGARRRLGASP